MPHCLASFLNQSFDPQDLAIVLLLVVLEGVLSIDNALVLGLLAKRLPKHQQQKALTYGLVGAFVFRLIAIALAAALLKWWIVKLLGGAYLVYVALKHFFTPAQDGHEPNIRTSGFWSTVIVIELTDVAFAIDSILAAIAMIPHSVETPNPKLWVVVAGGFIGVILMRFAAYIFIKLLDKFPRFELSAYLLVLVIGAKLLADWGFNKPPTPKPDGWHPPLDFHSPGSPTFWVFWGLMIACFAMGFTKGKQGSRV